MGSITDVVQMRNWQPTMLVNGRTIVTTAGTQVTLGEVTTLRRGVYIKALSTNLGTLYVGNASVSSADGYVLAAGAEVFLEIDDLAKIYIDASINNQGCTYLGS